MSPEPDNNTEEPVEVEPRKDDGADVPDSALTQATPVQNKPIPRREMLIMGGVFLAVIGSLGAMIKLSEPENLAENPILLECKKRKEELEDYIQTFFRKYDVATQNFPVEGLRNLVNRDHECLAAYKAVKFKVDEFWKYIHEVAQQKDLPRGLMDIVNGENDSLFVRTKLPVPYGPRSTTHLDQQFMSLRYKYFQAYDNFVEKVELDNLDEVLTSKGMTLLYITTNADCGSCMDSAQSMAIIADQYGKDVTIKKAVVPHGGRANLAPLIVKNIQIEEFPTMLLIIDGKISGRLEGGITDPDIVRNFAREATLAHKSGEPQHKASGNIPGMPTIGLYDD